MKPVLEMREATQDAYNKYSQWKKILQVVDLCENLIAMINRCCSSDVIREETAKIKNLCSECYDCDTDEYGLTMLFKYFIDRPYEISPMGEDGPIRTWVKDWIRRHEIAVKENKS